MAINAELADHLASGACTVCRCWALERKDGIVLGFTDHDEDIAFGGIVFAASSGMTASALQRASGLSVDNAEAVGALSHASLNEEDIMAGRFDNAGIRIWLVNWADVSQRQLQFAGGLGEIHRSGGAFETELRGMSERLNQTRGQIYQGPCAAIVGDARCKVDLAAPGFFHDAEVDRMEGGATFEFPGMPGFADGWFARGRFEVLTGKAAGLCGLIKRDATETGRRIIDLWEAISAPMQSGDMVRLTAGCDKQVETCRLKFANIENFRGFPHVPGEDWMLSYPTSTNSSG